MWLTKVTRFSNTYYYTKFQAAALRDACVDYTSEVSMVDTLLLPTDKKEI
jgi:hypothetical protein